MGGRAGGAGWCCLCFGFAETTRLLDRRGAPPQSWFMDTLSRLAATIAARRSADPETSWVAKLNARGVPVIARKLGEEAVETVVAALSGSREDLVGESADVLFHLLVLLDAKGVSLGEVYAELERREGTSGIAEKASRSE
jgi:phosphoribosyl-ATP pyrophosphohydrolase